MVRATSPRPDTARAILEAALPLFQRFGFKKTAVDDIARRAGVSKATIYLHFDSKAAIFAAAVREVSGAMLAAIHDEVAAAATPRDKVFAFLASRLHQLRHYALRHRSGDEVLLELLPMTENVAVDLFRGEVATLERLLAEGVAAGAFRPHDSGALALALMLAFRGLGREVMAHPDTDELDAGVDALLEALLDGLALSPAD